MMGARDDLRRAVSALLDSGQGGLDDGQDLLLLGLDSIRIMSLIGTLRATGVRIRFDELVQTPTLAAWWALIEGRSTAEPRTSPGTAPEQSKVAPGTLDPAAPFELTPVQHAYWIGREDHQELGGVGCQFFAEFDGQGVQPARLEQAVRGLEQRHGMLRARFLEDGTQRVDPQGAWAGLRVHDFRGLAGAGLEAAAEALRSELSHRRLDVANGQVFDVQLALLDGNATRIYVSLDLLVADVKSIQICLRDLAALYAGAEQQRPDVAYRFADYLKERASHGAAREHARAYWHARLPRLPGGPELPLAMDPRQIRRPHFTRRDCLLPAADWRRISGQARRHGVTPAMGLATAFTEVLAAWSAGPHFLLNLPVFDRHSIRPGVEHMVADFTNLVLLEVDARGKAGFSERARALQGRFRADISHGEYSGIEVLRDLAAKEGRRIAAPVVFACNISGGDLVDPEFRNTLGKPGWGISQTPQVWLDHQVTERDGGLYLNWDAVEELFEEGVLDAMFGAYRDLLERLAEGDWTSAALAEDLLPPAQRRVRERVNATSAPQSGKLLHQAFFERAEHEPERPALLWGEDGALSYGELAGQARRIGGFLGRQGLGPGDPVALTLPKGPEQVAAVLGVLWAGGVYVPIGVDQPAARRARMVERAGVRLALTCGSQSGGDWPEGVQVLGIADALAAQPLARPVEVAPEAPAYVIFTSGSTGEPKGVQIAHRAAVNTVEDLNARHGVTTSDRVLAVSALDFDLSVYDLFGLLSAGGALVLVEEEQRREPRAWLDLVGRHGVSVWNTVPALLDMLLMVLPVDGVGQTLRLALVSGDWIGLDLPERLARAWPACRLVALGGATEAAIWSNAFEFAGVRPGWRSIPYGLPLRNQCYRVVDARGRDCPDWVAGELWIGGAGVALGYVGEPELSAERFVVHGGQRWYRTGDLGRYWLEGTLEFLGRVDQQVKIRGHRVELGEIEVALAAHPDISDAVVVLAGGRKRRLTALVVAQKVTPEQASTWLAERLPEHMLPQSILVTGKAPLTANDKVDRQAVQALVERAYQDRTEPIEAPLGEIEVQVAALWAETLELPKVGRNQSFFALGGDSLLATRLVTRLRANGLLGAELRQLFANPTLAAFAATLTWGAKEGHAAIMPDRARRYLPFPATDVQRAYWVGRGDGFTLGGIGCHYYLELDGADLDLVRLEQAFQSLIRRHDMLRVVFDKDGQQRILPEIPAFPISVVTAGRGSSEAPLAALRETMSHQVFDPAVWPLFDIRAVRYDGGRVRLGVSLDNLALDALSVMLLFHEWALTYGQPGFRLPDIALSFRDYVLAAEPAPDTLATDQAYWRDRLTDLPPAPELPLRMDPALVNRPRFVRREARLEETPWNAITGHARAHDLTPSAVLLSCFATVLSAWNVRPELTLTLTLFDRRELHPQVQRVLGDFTSLFLLAYRPDLKATWLDNTRRLQEQLWRDLDHKGVSAVWVLRELARARGVAEVAMPVVFTSGLGLGKALPATPTAAFGEQVWGITQTPQVWLDHQVTERDGGLYLNWDAVEELFEEGVLDAMFGAYRDLLERLAEGDWTSAALAEDLLPPAQRRVRERVNATSAPQSGKLLHQAFFERAEHEPERPALLWGEDGALSYGELAGQARRIGGFLGRQGLGPGDPVALTLPKGPEQVAAVLGVLWAGGVYVPIGVDQPAARRARMVERAGVRLALTCGSQSGGDWPEGVQVLGIADALAAQPLARPVEVAPEAPAYVIFTSGSTGEPKGVQIAHRAAVNTVEDLNARHGVTTSDRVLAVSALDFDLSVYDLFGLLSAGGALVLVEEEQRREPRAWLDLVGRHGVSVWNTVPALLDMLLMVLPVDGVGQTLRLALVSGDWIGLDLPERLARAWPACRLVALGGATEAAIWSNAFEFAGVRPGWRSIPYGLPLRNQCYRVVDARGRDCPDWVAGELWIGGAGVALGYVGEPELSAERFVVHGGQRWYRTGDLGRYWLEGTLEFLGRVDQQVKIRGHRVELGEIEAALSAHPAISGAVAVATGDRGNMRLSAAIVCRKGGARPTAGDLLRAATAPLAPGSPTETEPGTMEGDARMAEALLVNLLAHQLGWTATRPRTGLAEHLGIAPAHDGVFVQWLDWLLERHVLAALGDFIGPGPRWAPALDWNGGVRGGALRGRMPSLADIVCGRREAITLLDDPYLSPEALLGADPANAAGMAEVARRLHCYSEALGRPLQVAEIGARGGHSAANLLGQVLPQVLEYTLLDESAALVERARERLKDSPHRVRCLSHAPDCLPWEWLHAFDAVVANNALHRFRDPSAGLELAELLLAPGGSLLALESSTASPLMFLSAALLAQGSGEGARLRGRTAWMATLGCGPWQGVKVGGSGPALLIQAQQPVDVATPDLEQLRGWLREHLPAHQQPGSMLLLPRLPLNANAKVDRHAVRDLVLRQSSGPLPSGAPPQGNLEQRLAAIWGPILGLEKIGRDQSFFALGGDSLSATRLVEAIRLQWPVDLTLRMLFTSPTIAGLAEWIGAGQSATSLELEEGSL